MNINPYEAPKAAPIQAQSAVVPSGEPHQPWSPSEVIGAAWQLVKPYAGKAWVMGMVASIATFVPLVAVIAIFSDGFGKAPPSATQSLLTMAAYLPCITFLNIGMIRCALTLVRGEEPGFALLFSGADRFVPLLAVQAIGVGLSELLELVFPATARMELIGAQTLTGIVYGSLAMLAAPLIVDAKYGPIEALKESFSTIGARYFPRTIGFQILGMLVVMLFCLPCGIPAPIGVAVLVVAQAIVYTRITGRMSPVV